MSHCEPGLLMRRATREDAALLWRWANDVQVRAMSLSTETIPWETHLRWLDERLQESSTAIYIFTTLDEQPLGQVRLQRDNRGASIALSVDVEHRGRGWGTQLVVRACLAYRQEHGPTAIHALIKPTNRASIATFARAGFVYVSRLSSRGEPVELWIHRE